MTRDNSDNIYQQQLKQVEGFKFDQQVVRVFPDMIQRSVPGYGLVLELSGLLARRRVTAGSHVYDLGCSLGASTLAVRRNILHRDCRIIGVDNSAAMVERCRQMLAADNSRVPVEIIQADILEATISNASLVMLNFTLQFIDPDQRLDLLQNIYQGLLPGGALLLAEKLHFDDPQANELLIDWHHDFKRSQGYSDLEIAQKRQALENVLRPDSIDTHISRLKQAGFEQVTPCFQALNFAAMVAIKSNQ